MRARFLRRASPRGVELDMTPMIDCCFQLVIFFMLSLKILTPEGDFNVTMPAGGQSPGELLPVTIRLRADTHGELAGIQWGDRPVAGFAALRQQVRAVCEPAAEPGGVNPLDVVFRCDPGLHYRYTVEAITAVTGYHDDRGHIVKLIDRVRFAPPE